MAARDYYDILGVSRSASEKEIRQAYRKLARQHHPDVNPGDKSAEGRFKEINTAHEVLSDPEKRKKYDMFGENWEHAGQFAGGGPRGRGRRGPEVEYAEPGDFDSILESILRGQGGRAGQHSQRGQDLETPVQISLAEAYSGTARVIELAAEQVCPSCGGKGCPACGGRGRVMQPRRLEVKIPAGVRDGSRVRIAGEGGPAFGRGAKGDLYLIVSVAPDSRFQRVEDDLNAEVEIPLMDAVLGGETRVPTADGKSLLLKIPPETQNGSVFRLAGKGMPRPGGGSRGDLLAKVRVVLPKGLSDKEKELFRKLKELRLQRVY